MSLASLTVAARRAPQWTLVVAAGCGAAFVALAVLVALGLTRAADLAFTVLFQAVASDAVDLIANAHTLAGQLVVTLTIAAALGVVVSRRLGTRAALALGLILATGGVELVFKFVLRHPGPPEEFARAFHNVLGVHLASPSSFPSGHLARLAFLAIVVAEVWPRAGVVAAGAAFLALSAYLRVYIGDHWISDSLAGLLLGTGAGGLAIAWMRATARR